MSISIKRYVLITSGVGASGGVAQRELIGRLFTDNPLVPSDAIVEFESASDVALYFGGASEEYKRAAFYFSFISKSLSAPKKIGFGRYAKVANEARIYGDRVTTNVAGFAGITAGVFTLTVGGQVATVGPVNLSAVTSMADVAAAVQTALRAESGSQFATALVVYDNVAGAFNFTSSIEAAAPIAMTDAGNLAGLLGWTTGAIYSPGVSVTSIADALAASVNVSNNFGAFAFVPATTPEEVLAASTWNAGENVSFMFCARTSVANASTIAASILTNQGTALTLAPLADEYDELVPMMILAATNYDGRATTQNYMFQVANLTPKVTTNSDADLYDALRVNYYGNTQTAGQQINFYQRGVLMGSNTAPVAMNTYANEMSLKDAAQSALMGLLMALPEIPANAEGRSAVLGILQDPINRSLRNGTISVGKTLTTAQKLFVAQVTGDELAWHQVENIGYWIDAVIEPYVQSGVTQYRAAYTLVYSKDDTVNKVIGQHTLI